MIYKASTDPIFLKKIYLRTWTLRNQFEAMATSLLQNKPDLSLKEMNDIIHTYNDLSFLADSKLNFLTDEEREKFLRAMNDLGEKIEKVDEDIDKMLWKFPTPLRATLPEEQRNHGSMFLSAIQMDGLYFFSNAPYIIGQNILIEFIVPNNFILSAEILGCRYYGIASKIVSEHKRSYQINAKFTFLRQGERNFLRKFLAAIVSTNGNAKANENAASAEGNAAGGGGGGGGEDGLDIDKLDL